MTWTARSFGSRQRTKARTTSYRRVWTPSPLPTTASSTFLSSLWSGKTWRPSRWRDTSPRRTRWRHWIWASSTRTNRSWCPSKVGSLTLPFLGVWKSDPSTCISLEGRGYHGAGIETLNFIWCIVFEYKSPNSVVLPQFPSVHRYVLHVSNGLGI